MSISLKYLWIKKYGCLENTSFQFDTDFAYSYDEKQESLRIEGQENDLPDDFWDKERRILGIHAIVGDNGRGKTTFLRAIMDIFTQIYPVQSHKIEEYRALPYHVSALMLIKDEKQNSYKALCMGVGLEPGLYGVERCVLDAGSHADGGTKVLLEIESVTDKYEIRKMLKKVKAAYFSNLFDYRDYNIEKAHHISDYSFGGLLKEDYRRQKKYGREDGYEDPVKELVFHNVYRQVSFMTEFYSSLGTHDQKRMFVSWPEYLSMHFMGRAKQENIQFYGVFEKVLEREAKEQDVMNEVYSAGVMPAILLAGTRLGRVFRNKISELENVHDKIKYRLCRETFQNLLMVDDFKSFYQAPGYRPLGEKLQPIVEAVCVAIGRFGDVRTENGDGLPVEYVFDFYCELLKELERVAGKQADEEDGRRVGAVAAHYAEMLRAVLSLPEGIFEYRGDSSGETFAFRINTKNEDHIKLFRELIKSYKKVIAPFTFLGFDWGMSSGEDNLLSLYARLFAMRDVVENTNHHKKGIVNYIQNLEEETQRSSELHEKVESNSVWILMDETDLTFHPRWQKELVSNIAYFFPKILPHKNMKFQIFLTTHSPILLGDMPRQSVIYMAKEAGKICVKRDMLKNTFGQNLYVLFQDSFFIDGPMGKLASDKLEEILGDIITIREAVESWKEENDPNNPETARTAKLYLERLDFRRRELSMFGDKVVVHKLTNLADICSYRLRDYLRWHDASVESSLRMELKQLNDKKAWLEKRIAELEKK